MSVKCVILGGGGFIGSHLSNALLAHGDEVRIFDRPNLSRESPFAASANCEWVEGDFLNIDDVSKAVTGCQVVFHLVSTTLPKSSNDNPLYDVESNVTSTINMLDVAVRTGVTKVVFASSGGTIYGIPLETPIREMHPTDPICSYGIGKLAIEKYLHLYYLQHGLEYCILRMANPYGEGQRPTSSQGAVAVFLDRALKNKAVEIWGDGTVIRDYVYVGDVADAFMKAMEYSGEHRIFNIGSGQGCSVRELISNIETVIHRPIARIYLAGRTCDVPANVLDISRASKFLNWQPATSFEDGLAHTWHWLSRVQ
jgi:UDP-glucose 4-epimerase